jgi:hypothetical protein
MISARVSAQPRLSRSAEYGRDYDRRWNRCQISSDTLLTVSQYKMVKVRAKVVALAKYVSNCSRAEGDKRIGTSPEKASGWPG